MPAQQTVTIEEARELAKAERGRRFGERRRKEVEEKEARRERLMVTVEPETVRLPFPPALNRYWRTRVVGSHANVYISKAGKAYRKAVISQWASVGKTYERRLAVRIDAVMPDRRERDLDGIPKALLDALEHAGAFERDSEIKLLIVNYVAVEPPGWVTVTIGPKPGECQGTLFDMGW